MMKVSVFEITMSDGSGGRLAVPFVPEENRGEMAALFKGDHEKIRYVGWCMNAWISDEISEPVRVDWKEVAMPEIGVIVIGKGR